MIYIVAAVVPRHDIKSKVVFPIVEEQEGHIFNGMDSLKFFELIILSCSISFLVFSSLKTQTIS